MFLNGPAMSLIEHLKQIRDFRTQPHYPLWVVLVLVLMGTMSGCLGYRALADFVERHQAALLEVMGLSHKRLPAYSTIRRVMVEIDPVQWATSIVKKSLNSLVCASATKPNAVLGASTIVMLPQGCVSSPEPFCTVLGSKSYCPMRRGGSFGHN